jgi:hypothetical protein
MAFRCDINDEYIEVEPFHEDRQYHVMLLKLGDDIEAGKTYTAEVGLNLGIGGIDHDLYFLVLEQDRHTNWIEKYWSGLNTRKIFVDPLDRARILSAICEMTLRLLKMVNPGRVCWYTHDDFPPGKALFKYDRIVTVFG